VIDPLGRVLIRRKLRGWQLYVLALLANSTVASSFLVLVWMGLGWWEPYRWGQIILVRSLFIFVTTVFVFPLALWQASQLKSMVGSLRRRVIRAADFSPWPTFAAFRRDCLGEASRWQGLAYKGFVYLALGVIFCTLIVMVTFALDTTPASPGSEPLRSPLRGVPLILTIGGLFLIAVGFLYFVLVTAIRAVLAVRWLYRFQRSFIFEVNEQDDDGCGGFLPIGRYAVTMITIPLILSMWTSFVAFRDAKLDDSGCPQICDEVSVAEQVAKLCPLYALEAALLVVGTAIPLWVGRSIVRRALRNRREAIDEELSRATAVGDDIRRQLFEAKKLLASRVSTWPIGRRELAAMAAAGAIGFATFSDLAWGSFRIMGHPEIGFTASMLVTVLGIVHLLILIALPVRAQHPA
jgi:hypothetical protein